MDLVTAGQLERRLREATDILYGRMDVSEIRHAISGLLLLKWAADQSGALGVTETYRQLYRAASNDANPGEGLNRALRELSYSLPPEAMEGVLDSLDFEGSRMQTNKLRSLLEHFGSFSLREQDLEFKDVAGRAYDRLLSWFAELSGAKSGNWNTPRSVVRMMVRLVRPEPGQSVYDPFAGSGGMLVHAREYVDEHTGRGPALRLFGQEVNSAAWFTAQVNLLLHGATDTSILHGDTLADPLHHDTNGRLRTFDRVLSNPPFSMNYTADGMRHEERMTYGWAPPTGRKADLMNVQHVLAVLRPDGIGSVVTPHGVLFRGGAEGDIRRRIVEDGRIEAVIGIGPNVFYGTSVPACVLVLRGSNGLAPEHRGKVLFINAENEIVSGRTQNRLEPEHTEKIVTTFRDRLEVPGFSRVVSLEEIAANDYNLNIRRYIDAAPPAEPLLDVQAALHGGVPRSEVESRADTFQSFGINLVELFQPRDTRYFDFPHEGHLARAAAIPGLAAPRENEILDHTHAWWREAEDHLTHLAGRGEVAAHRGELMASFRQTLMPLGTLNEYQLDGLFAAWWDGWQEELRSLGDHGFLGVLSHWAAEQGTTASHVSERAAREFVLKKFQRDLLSRERRVLATERQKLVDMYLAWGDRYATSLSDLERQRATGAARLAALWGASDSE